MKLFLLLLVLFPAMLIASEETTDDHNNLATGIISPETIRTLKIFESNYSAYTPKPGPLEAIHKYGQPAELRVIFGDWCSDSKKHVPALMKTMDLAGNNNIKVTYVNVHRKKEDRGDLVAGLDIQAIPTFIVYGAEGKEMGRIVETPKVSVEQDLADILAAK